VLRLNSINIYIVRNRVRLYFVSEYIVVSIKYRVLSDYSHSLDERIGRVIELCCVSWSSQSQY